MSTSPDCVSFSPVTVWGKGARQLPQLKHPCLQSAPACTGPGATPEPSPCPCRLPVHVYEQMLKINKARKQFIDDNDRMPTNEELSKASGIGMERLELVVKVSAGFPDGTVDFDLCQQASSLQCACLCLPGLCSSALASLLQAHNDPMHLDAPSAFGGDDGDGSTIGDYIRDPAPSPFQMLLNKSLEKDLDNLLLTLTPREAAVVSTCWLVCCLLSSLLKILFCCIVGVQPVLSQREASAVHKPAKGSVIFLHNGARLILSLWRPADG